MSNQDDLTVKKGVVTGALFMLVYVTVLFNILPRFSAELELAQRLKLGVQCLIFPCLMLLFGLLRVGMQRYGNEAQDPTKVEASSTRMAVDIRYTSNTHEQLSLFLVSTLGLACLLPYAYLHWLPMSSALFVIGRIFFWWGYQVNVLYRAPGFGMTVFPSVLGLFYCAFKVVTSLF